MSDFASNLSLVIFCMILAFACVLGDREEETCSVFSLYSCAHHAVALGNLARVRICGLFTFRETHPFPPSKAAAAATLSYVAEVRPPTKCLELLVKYQSLIYINVAVWKSLSLQMS